ncbi:NucA/NucB deoxyribonuclease domain-containing protein [Chitinophaga defluvii]|uniref:NucA/NucB deoxyribonuclease domain-containing protein n=1 Tax=Chitinophaga defluvii TaxID=3163343 RepID=A0ABV2T203_9BACT
MKGLAKNPGLRGNNGRILLDYDPSKSNARKRRYQATKNVVNPDPMQFDIDEFPYASTLQGGANAGTNIVRISENRQHSAYLGTFSGEDERRRSV